MEIITTMITPYRADGSVDFETAEKYVDFLGGRTHLHRAQV